MILFHFAKKVLKIKNERVKRTQATLKMIHKRWAIGNKTEKNMITIAPL